jgi:hypothetical protein
MRSKMQACQHAAHWLEQHAGSLEEKHLGTRVKYFIISRAGDLGMHFEHV